MKTGQRDGKKSKRDYDAIGLMSLTLLIAMAFGFCMVAGAAGGWRWALGVFGGLVVLGSFLLFLTLVHVVNKDVKV